MPLNRNSFKLSNQNYYRLHLNSDAYMEVGLAELPQEYIDKIITAVDRWDMIDIDASKEAFDVEQELLMQGKYQKTGKTFLTGVQRLHQLSRRLKRWVEIYSTHCRQYPQFASSGEKGGRRLFHPLCIYWAESYQDDSESNRNKQNSPPPNRYIKRLSGNILFFYFIGYRRDDLFVI